MPRPSFLALLKTTAISVATILGSGILGLPVSLYKSGCEILQRAQIDLAEKYSIDAIGGWETLDYGIGTIDPLTTLDNPHETYDSDQQAPTPSLHSFADLYLPSMSLKILFEAAVMLHFVSILSSYTLGAPQAFEEVFPNLFHVSHRTMILGFAVIASFAVICFSDAIVLPLTVATFFKGGLLSAVVIWILSIGIGVGLHPSTDWSFKAGLEPLLMGSLALAGCINLMPKLWEICLTSTGLPWAQAMDKEFVVWFRLAINSAVVICYILNILWCTGVLLIVPQTGPIASRMFLSGITDWANELPNMSLFGRVYRIAGAVESAGTSGNSANVTTLAHANLLGEISTIPLVEVLKSQSRGNAHAIFGLINMFVFVSITVSFLVVGIGMKHILDDLAKSFIKWVHRQPSAASPSPLQLRRQTRFVRVLFNVCSFSIVALIAVSNPKLLLKIMAGVTSLCANIEGGLLIMVMLFVARRRQAYDAAVKPVPAQMGPVLASITLTIGFGYFVFVIGLDIINYLPHILG